MSLKLLQLKAFLGFKLWQLKAHLINLLMSKKEKEAIKTLIEK